MPSSATFTVVASRVVGANAGVAYALIADYQGGHQRILPPKYFGNLRASARRTAASRQLGGASGADWRRAAMATGLRLPSRCTPSA